MGSLSLPVELIVTDGTIEVDLVGGPIKIDSWNPASPNFEGEGVYQRVSGTVVDTLSLKANGATTDSVIGEVRKLERLSQKALEYKNSRWQTSPVWVQMRGRGETGTLYALVLNGRIPEGENPFGQYFESKWWHIGSVWEGFSWVFEHLNWGATRPLTGETLLFNTNEIVNLVTDGDLENWTSSTNLTSWGETGTVEQNSNLLYVNSGSYSAKISGSAGNPAYISQTFQLAADADIGMRYFARARVYIEYGIVEFRIQHGPGTIATKSIAKSGWNEIDILGIDTTGGSNVFVAIGGIPLPADALFYVDTIKAGYLVGATESGYIEPQSPIPISNKYVTQGLTHIYQHDSGSWISGNFVTTTGLTIGGNTIGDATYFGIESTAVNPGPFNNIVMRLTTLAEDYTFAWEYWDGATWSSVAGLSSNAQLDTNLFSVVSWGPESDWTAADLSVVGPAGGPSVTALWVRVRVIAVGAKPVLAELDATANIYTSSWNYFSTDQIEGDIGALLNSVIIPKYDTDEFGEVEAVIAGVRSAHRGAGFQSYINISDRGNGFGITVSPATGSSSYVNDVTFPTGRRRRLTTGGVFNGFAFEVTLSGASARDFEGHFRAFYIVTHPSMTDVLYEFSYTVDSVTSFSGEIPFESGVSGDFLVYDLGEVNIAAIASDEAHTVTLRIRIESTNVASYNIDSCALVLIPVDEWSGEFRRPQGTTLAAPEDSLVNINSIEYQGKQRNVGCFVNLETGQRYSKYIARSGDEYTLSPRYGDQEVHFMFVKSGTYDTSPPLMTFSSYGEKQDRYLLNRGDDLIDKGY